MEMVNEKTNLPSRDANVESSLLGLCSNLVLLVDDSWSSTFALNEFFGKYGAGNEMEIEFLEQSFQLPRVCIKGWSKSHKGNESQKTS